MRSETRRVRALHLDETSIPIRRATLSLSQDELAGGVPGLKRWNLSASLADYTPVEVGVCQVHAELDDDEVLDGPGIVTNANHLTITVRSSGAWTGISDW